MYRLIAFNETAFWPELPEGCTDVWGIYLYKEGEATHLASLTPSSWCEFIRNDFIGIDASHPFVEEHSWNGTSDYFAFIENPTQPVSAPFDADDWDEAIDIAHTDPPYLELPA